MASSYRPIQVGMFWMSERNVGFVYRVTSFYIWIWTDWLDIEYRGSAVWLLLIYATHRLVWIPSFEMTNYICVLPLAVLISFDYEIRLLLEYLYSWKLLFTLHVRPGILWFHLPLLDDFQNICILCVRLVCLGLNLVQIPLITTRTERILSSNILTIFDTRVQQLFCHDASVLSRSATFCFFLLGTFL